RFAVDRDAVVVEDQGELVELEMAGESDRLLRYALHEAAVAGEHIGAMIDEIIAEAGVEVAFGDRHADGIADTLAERPGRRLDACGVAVFGMPGSLGADLAELFDILDGHVLVAEEIEQRVEQHAAMAGGEHEAVAVGPMRIGGIEFEKAGKE